LAQHVVLGLTNKEIACKLNISDQTVKNHIHRILRKLGAKDRQKIAEMCRPPETSQLAPPDRKTVERDLNTLHTATQVPFVQPLR
jgi:predicted ArsR family transcriptional regulator